MTPRDKAREQALALLFPEAGEFLLSRLSNLYDLGYSDGRLAGVLDVGNMMRPLLKTPYSDRLVETPHGT